MFRQSAKFKALLAFLLSATVLYNWAACLSSCEEAAEPHSQTSESAEKQVSNEDCFDQTNHKESCSMTATAVVLQERQTVGTFAPAIKESFSSVFHPPAASWSALLPEAKQNSPPVIASATLFVQFCNFRI